MMEPMPERSRTHTLPGGGHWIDHDLDVVEIERLADLHDLPDAAVEDVLDIEQLPKREQHGDQLFVVFHALTTGPDDRLDTIEVDCFVTGDSLITMHRKAVPSIDWLWERLDEHTHLAADGPATLLGHLAELIGRRYLSIIDEFERRIDELADDALVAAPHVLSEIQMLRREESTIRTMLNPQLRVLDDLISRTVELVDDPARRQLVDAYDAHAKVVSSLGTARQLMTDTLDTYRGAVAERQGRAANLLTVYAAIVLPMTLIAGWYGMNTQNLPASDRPWGWIVVTAVMVAVGVVSWLWFARIGLVGRPRLAAPVGRSLAAAARAPMRPVTMLRQARTTGSRGTGRSNIGRS